MNNTSKHSIVLRDYQLDMLCRLRQAWRRHHSVMVQMPTGTGKTAVLAEAVRERMVRSDGVVWVVAHRRELVSQIQLTIDNLQLTNAGAANTVRIDRDRVRVYSIQWLGRNWEEVSEEHPELIVIDEAHHSLAESYRELWRRYPDARKLGMTATPCRLDNKGFTGLFEVLLQSWSIAEFIRKGLLSLFDYVSIGAESNEQRQIDGLQKRGADGDYQVKEMEEVLNHRSNIERLYASLCEYAPGRKGIVYAISVSHAKEIAAYYSSQGLAAAAIDSRTPAKERREKIEAFRQGELSVLVNVDVFSEGFDCPDVEFVQLARPTLSLAKYLQQVGRGLRRVDGKSHCILIDNVGLHRVFGLPIRNWDWKSLFEGRMRGRATGPARRLKRVEPESDAGTGTSLPEEAMEVVVSHRDLPALIEEVQESEACRGLKYYADDMAASVDGQGRLCYVDMRNGRRYDKRPTLLRYGGGVELLRIDDTYYSRTREPYENRSQVASFLPVWHGWYLLMGDLYPPEGYRYLVGENYDTHASVCLPAGEAERVYWLSGRLEDGTLLLVDGAGALYHAERGKRIRRIAEEDVALLVERAGHRVRRRMEQAESETARRQKRRLESITAAEPFRAGAKWGLRQGDRIVVPAIYRRVLSPVGRYCAFEGNPRQWGVLRVDGRIEVEARYEKVEIGKNNTARLTVWPGKEKTVKLGV